VVPEDNKLRQKELEKTKRQTIAEALKAEQEAAELARRAAEEAALQQKLLEKQLAQIKTQSSPAAKPSSRSGSSSLTGLEMQYYSTIAGRIAQFWALPEYKKWDPATEAVVVITISQNGSILKQFFEKRSNDPTFDQFVRKTLQDASPLPPIPPALQRTSWEVGLRFRPEGIQ
jgi:colicin import membrane protein